MVTNKLIFETLLADIQDQEIKRVLVGFNWTFVETKWGCGIAKAPSKTDESCETITNAGKLTRLTTRDVSRLIFSKNPVEVSIGLATINAFYNRFDFEASDENGLNFFNNIEGPIIVIGRFPALARRFRNFKIIERNPREGEYSEKDAEKLLPDSAGVIITSSTLLNGSAGNLIELSRNAPVCLIGPSTPFAPKLLNLGINCLAGTIVTNPEKMFVAIAEGGSVKTLKPHGSFKVLSR